MNVSFARLGWLYYILYLCTIFDEPENFSLPFFRFSMNGFLGVFSKAKGTGKMPVPRFLACENHPLNGWFQRGYADE